MFFCAFWSLFVQFYDTPPLQNEEMACQKREDVLVFGRLGWTVFLLRQNLVCPGFEGELQLLSYLDLFTA